MLNLAASEVWFVTGSQHLYGPETLATVAEHANVIAAALDAASSIPVRGCARSPSSRDRTGSSPSCARRTRTARASA